MKKECYSSSDSEASPPATSHFIKNGPKILSPPPRLSATRSLSAGPIDVHGEFTFARATCDCRLSDMRVPFRTKDLPIHNNICHCSFCRHSNGQMAFSTVKIAGVPLQLYSDETFPLDNLSSYIPHDMVGVTRWFCPTCSALVLITVDTNKYREMDTTHDRISGCGLGEALKNLNPETGGIEWRVASGALVNEEGFFHPVSHTYISTTMDGGLAEHLRIINGIELARYSEGKGSAQLPLHWRSPELKEMQSNELNVYCHCRSVHVRISPPEAAAYAPSVPYPDLLLPSATTRLAVRRNIKDEKWWMKPPLKEGGRQRYLAGHCACNYCRFTSGFEVQSWAFVPRVHMREAGKDEPIDFYDEDFRPKNLKQYVASPGRYREFCGKCGATAFWWDAGRPDLIDYSIGLTDATQDGVRAEHWFYWHKDRVSHSDATKSPLIIKGLIDGLKESESAW